MILDILIFTLGALVSGLLALAALPAVWRRALRLSGERLSRLVPLSAEEIAAERDHLRAAHAVELRRTEQRLERTEDERAALRVEAARREGRILLLNGENARAQVTVAALEADVARLRREVDGLRAESGAKAIALHGLSVLAEDRFEAIAALGAERDALAHEVDRGRGRVAGLETRLLGAEVRHEDLQRALDQARRDAVAAAERPETAPPPNDLRALLEARAREVKGLTAGLAFMTEQRTTEAIEAQGAPRAERAGALAPDAAPPLGDETARLRAAVAALAEDMLRSGRTA